MRVLSRVIFVLILLSLAACNQSASTSIPPCLVSIWELTGTEAFSRALIPPGSVDLETITYLGDSGGAAYKFSEDGTISIQLVGWVSRFNVQDEGIAYTLEFHAAGWAIGKYQYTDGTIEILGVNSESMSFMASLDKELMLDSQRVEEFLPLFLPPFTKARVTCSEDSLNLEILNLPTNDEGISFQRVEE